MKKRRSDPVSIAEGLQRIVERQRLAGELLIALANAVAAHERTQTRFRYAAISTLARIQSTVTMIHGAQIAEAHMSRPGHEERLDEHAKSADEFIATKSQAIGESLVRLIYSEEQTPALSRGRRKQWSGWEI